ncbi:hypothetical protein F5I97DRAFT_676556 [Phlebopus sp. FC_14]|nr:hypothetical protein F5I97DRAFT_676556 [Phlebopus sp. FC_14]
MPVPDLKPTRRSRAARPNTYARIAARGLLAREAVLNIADSLRRYSNGATRGDDAASAEQVYNRSSSPLELRLPTQIHLIDGNIVLSQRAPLDPRIALSNAIAWTDSFHRADNEQHFIMNQELSPENPGPSYPQVQFQTLDTTKYSADNFVQTYGWGPSPLSYSPYGLANVQSVDAAVYNHLSSPQQSPSTVGPSLNAGWSSIHHSVYYPLGNDPVASQPTQQQQHHHHHSHSPQFALPPPPQGPSSQMSMQQTGPQAGGTTPLPTHHARRQCEWHDGSDTCPGWVLGKNRDMQHHLRSYHAFSGSEREEVPCRWTGCSGVLQRQNMGRHVVAVHLRAGATCGRCYRRFCRPDVATRHERLCDARVASRLAVATRTTTGSSSDG